MVKLIKHTGSNRNQWVSEAAYYKAELRGFVAGNELNDWVQAEIEYNQLLVRSFLVRCQEDGGISITDLQGLADSIGVVQPESINTKRELIREIQKKSQQTPCFQDGSQANCKRQPNCEWRKECKKLIAAWYRQTE